MSGGEARRDLGRYRLLFELAAGGMGTVHLARHRGAGGFERLVVIKRIHPHLAAARELVDMFLDEARLASQIRHPNVVPVDDVVDAGGVLLLAQPYIESVSLGALLAAAAAAGERLAPALVSRILLDALAGLDGAHHAVDLRGERLEIIHRDVSPQNILVGADGRSRLIDFGIAKAARRIAVTRTGTLKGKVRYMAPEQLRRQAVDARADVFSAGVVLYEALTGVPPFAGEDEGDTLLSVLLGEPPRPSTLVAGLPTALDEVVARALATSREERYPSASALHEALEGAVPPAPPREVALAVERLCGEAMGALRERVRACLDAGEEDELEHEPTAPSRPRRGLVVVLGLAALGALGAGILLGGARTHEGLAATPAPVATPSAVAPLPSLPIAGPTIAPTASAPPAPSAPAAPRPAAAPRVRPSASASDLSDLHPNPYQKSP